MKTQENETGAQRYVYYQALTSDECFRQKVSTYKRNCAEFGLPIPLHGLPTEEARAAWIDRVHKEHYLRKSSEDYQRALNKITGGKEQLSLAQSIMVDELNERMLPPMPFWKPLKQIMKESVSGIREPDLWDFEFIIDHVLAGRVADRHLKISYQVSHDPKHGPCVRINLYGDGRVQDIRKHWREILALQKTLPTYSGRHRKLMDDDETNDRRSSEAHKSARKRRAKILKNHT